MKYRALFVSSLFVMMFMLSLVTTYASEYTGSEIPEAKSGPFVDKIIYNVITGDDAQVLALLNDDIDLIGDMVDPTFYETLSNASDIEIAEVMRNGYGYMTINCDKYPFNITNFRRALAFAVDKEKIVDEVWDGLAVPQDSCVPQVNPFSVEGQLSYTYYDSNIALGNQLLDSAGFVDHDSDGIREAPDGSEFDVLIEVAQSSNVAIEIGSIFADALSNLGVNATSQPTDYYEYLNRLYFHGNYEIVFVGKSFQDFDVDWLGYEYWSEFYNEPYYNYPKWRNATYDSWRDQLLHSTDYEEVYSAAYEMQEIWVHACPAIICYENTLLSVYRNDTFKGFVNDAVDGIPSYWTNMQAHLKDTNGVKYGGELRWSNPLDVDSFNFMASSSSYADNVNQMMWDSLLQLDPDGNYIKSLASSFKIETHDDDSSVPDGHTRFTFDIVTNASWSDGTALTADDVAFTFNYYLEGSIEPYVNQFSELFAAYAPTDYRVVVEFSTESYWHLSSIATLPILPYHIFTDIGLDGWNSWNPDPTDPDDADNPYVTSGPFYVSEYVAGEFTELSKNPYYFKNPQNDYVAHEKLIQTYETATSTSDGQVSSQAILSELPDGDLIWTSRNNPTPQTISNSSVLLGDHVVVNATWPDGNGVDNVSISFYSGLAFEATNDLVVPDPTYDPFSGLIETDQFSWQFVSGIEEGEPVDIEVSFTNGDSDIMVWWKDTDNTTWTYANNLVKDEMSTGAKPEVGSFVADRSGVLAIGCFDYDQQVGEWTLHVETGADYHYGPFAGLSCEVDTYDLCNGIYTIKATAKSESETHTTTTTEVNITNHFVPTVDLTNPNSGSYSGDVTIQWSISDLNEDDVHSSNVYISKDSGQTYMLLARNLAIESFVVDSNIWMRLSSYRVLVRVSDPYRFVTEDISDATITFGSDALGDETPPVVMGEEFVHITTGTTGNQFEWLAFDAHVDSYEIWYQGTELENGDWNNGFFSVDCDADSDGMYNYTLRVIDESGQSTSLTTWVVAGEAIPSINQPDDIDYLYGSSGNTITWSPRHFDPYWYDVYQNGTLVTSEAWDGDDISISIDGLSIGTYNYTIKVTSGSGEVATDTVIVRVVENTTPPSTNTTTSALPFTEYLMMVITLASLGIIVVVSVLIIRSRR